ncbi:MAG: hypothetical protein ACNYNX_06560 [Leucobacter sp.]
MANSPEGSAHRTGGVSPKLIVVIVLAVLALIFVFSNLGTATLHFLGFSFAAPGWIWFLLLLVVGVVIGSIFPWFRPKKKAQK